MDSSLRTPHTQQEALPTSLESIPSSPCISPSSFQTLHRSGKSELVPPAVFREVPNSDLLLSPLVRHPAGCNYETPCSPEKEHQLHVQGGEPLLCYMLIPGISLPEPTGIGYTGISYRESIPDTGTTSPDPQRNKENAAQCTQTQENVRAAGVAGAKSPPSPGSRVQQ